MAVQKRAAETCLLSTNSPYLVHCVLAYRICLGLSTLKTARRTPLDSCSGIQSISLLQGFLSLSSVRCTLTMSIFLYVCRTLWLVVIMSKAFGNKISWRPSSGMILVRLAHGSIYLGPRQPVASPGWSQELNLFASARKKHGSSELDKSRAVLVFGGNRWCIAC